MLNKLFIGFGTALLLFYSATALFGWEYFAPTRETRQAAEARHRTGTMPRSFWFFGSRGGK